MNRQLVERVVAWIAVDPDAADRATLEQLVLDGDEAELRRRFDVPLTFGTAGLRGPVMAGPSGMNRCSVRRATQGVVAWLAESGADVARGVVVGRDARHGSEAFNDEVVGVLLGAGVAVHEMPEPMPTPFVPFAVQQLGAAAGIMITASHNPPQDNGYKLYGGDGSQIISPSDRIVEENASRAPVAHLATRDSPLYHRVDAALLAAYHEHVVARFGVTESELDITYTPLHGVGGASMMSLFRAAGFARVHPVVEQFVPDPAFPTLPFPNPEEPGALDLALATAQATSSSLVIANDPDADRLGAAVRGPEGWRVLRGDEIGWLLASFLLPSMSGEDVVATSIVSSGLLEAMAQSAGVRFSTTLTGFKWISRAAGERVLRFGYEEALGYAVDPSVRDKDGLSAALALCRLADDLAREGCTLLDRLDEIEEKFGVHAVDQLSVRMEGPDARAAIERAVAGLRDDPPAHLGGLRVVAVADLEDGWRGLAPTSGVYLSLGDAGRVVVRPSGTEPKVKAYLECTEFSGEGTLSDRRATARARLASIREDVAARWAR